MHRPPADGWCSMQPGSGKRQTAWRAAVAALAYGLLLRCGLMDLQERLLTRGCALNSHDDCSVVWKEARSDNRGCWHEKEPSTNSPQNPH